MDTTTLVLLILFGAAFLGLMSKWNAECDLLRLIVWLWTTTQQMAKDGKFKKTKKERKKDKSPGTIFDWSWND